MKPIKYEYLKPGDIIRYNDEIKTKRDGWALIHYYVPSMIGEEYQDCMKKMRRRSHDAPLAR